MFSHAFSKSVDALCVEESNDVLRGALFSRTPATQRSSQRQQRRIQRTGVTLIDLTVTILILGILVAVTAPKFAGSMSYFRSESAAERLAADMRGARRQAIDKSTPQSLRFSTSKDLYVLLGMNDPDHPGERYTVELNGYPYNSHIVKLSFSEANLLTFDIHGQCNFSGEIVLASGNSSKTVQFTAESGEVVVQ